MSGAEKIQATAPSSAATAAKAPKVSVIVPNYNYGRYLGERIQSLLAQTFQDFELIIVDDGSTDDSVKIIKKYADPRIRTKFFAENGGKTFRCHNVGAQMARGEYLIFAESDDSCHPTLLERLVGILDAHPSVGRATARYHKWWSNWVADAASEWQAEAFDAPKVSLPKRGAELANIALKNKVGNVSGSMVRRTVFDAAGGFDTDYHWSGDWKLWSTIALLSDTAYLEARLSYWRMHKASVSHTAEELPPYGTGDARSTEENRCLVKLEFMRMLQYLWADARYRQLLPLLSRWRIVRDLAKYVTKIQKYERDTGDTEGRYSATARELIGSLDQLTDWRTAVLNLLYATLPPVRFARQLVPKLRFRWARLREGQFMAAVRIHRE